MKWILIPDGRLLYFDMDSFESVFLKGKKSIFRSISRGPAPNLLLNFRGATLRQTCRFTELHRHEPLGGLKLERVTFYCNANDFMNEMSGVKWKTDTGACMLQVIAIDNIIYIYIYIREQEL